MQPLYLLLREARAGATFVQCRRNLIEYLFFSLTLRVYSSSPSGSSCQGYGREPHCGRERRHDLSGRRARLRSITQGMPLSLPRARPPPGHRSTRPHHPGGISLAQLALLDRPPRPAHRLLAGHHGNSFHLGSTRPTR